MKTKSLLSFLLLAVICLWSMGLRAGIPQEKLVMLDVEVLANVTSKHAPDNTHLSWEELIEAGINGVHFRSWTFSGDGSYSQREWVEEAHDHGLWVCGGTGNSVEMMTADGANLALMGVDFIQLDEPMGHASLTEAGYHTIRNSVRAVDPTVPVIITDVFYNDIITGWSNVDGIMQEVYVDQWYPDKRNEALAYLAAHPGQSIFMWVWLLTKSPTECVAYPDSKFDTWFLDSFNYIGKVLLFIFNQRDYGDPTNCDAGAWGGTNWPARVATIQSATTGYRKAMTTWRNFAPSAPVDNDIPDCSVQVSSSAVGLNPSSIECFYSTNGGQSWNKWQDVSCTGSSGTTAWETITARRVPFAQTSDSLNKIRFRITDIYSGTYYRGPRTGTRDYTVNVTGRHWTEIEPDGPIGDLTPSLSIQVQDTSHGLDVSSATAEYSSDGGRTWQNQPVTCSGVSGSSGLETVSAPDVPFNQEGSLLNKIRFSINNSQGNALHSQPNFVPIAMLPSFAGFTPQYTDDLSPDCAVELLDAGGLALGASEGMAHPDTVLLLHFNGSLDDASKNKYTAALSGNPQWLEMETWKTAGGQEQMLHFDGVDDYLSTTPITVGGSAMTISAWVKADNGQEAIAYGGVEEKGSLIFRFTADRVTLAGRGPGGTNLSLNSEVGSFAFGNQWHHVTATIDGDEVKLYINGLLRGSATWAGYPLLQSTYFSLGRALNRTRFFSGTLDEVMLTQRALSNIEIAAAYFSGQYRYSKDGGNVWETDWMPCTITPEGGVSTSAHLSAEALPFEQYSMTLNKIAFLVKDKLGYLSSEEFLVRVTEDGDPCIGKECGDGCGDCPLGQSCVDNHCVEADGGISDGGETDGGEDENVALGGCNCHQPAGPIDGAFALLGALILAWLAVRRRKQNP